MYLFGLSPSSSLLPPLCPSSRLSYLISPLGECFHRTLRLAINFNPSIREVMVAFILKRRQLLPSRFEVSSTQRFFQKAQPPRSAFSPELKTFVQQTGEGEERETQCSANSVRKKGKTQQQQNSASGIKDLFSQRHENGTCRTVQGEKRKRTRTEDKKERKRMKRQKR